MSDMKRLDVKLPNHPLPPDWRAWFHEMLGPGELVVVRAEDFAKLMKFAPKGYEVATIGVPKKR
jgi:hypothetical protein